MEGLTVPGILIFARVATVLLFIRLTLTGRLPWKVFANPPIPWDNRRGVAGLCTGVAQFYRNVEWFSKTGDRYCARGQHGRFSELRLRPRRYQPSGECPADRGDKYRDLWHPYFGGK